MLIDDILSPNISPSLIAKFPMLDGLRSANVFVMTDAAILAASHLTVTTKTSATIIDQFRLPYSVCWIEAAQDKKQVGWYLDARAEEVFVLKFRSTPDVAGVKAAGLFAPDTLEFLAGQTTGRSYFIECEPLQIMEQAGEHAHELLADAALQAMAMIAVINSPAISKAEPSDLAKLNKRRVERGKDPLLEYHTIRIRSEIANSLKDHTDSDKDGKKLHWRRGHFKSLTKRKSGLYWWNHHLAGIKGGEPGNKKYIV